MKVTVVTTTCDVTGPELWAVLREGLGLKIPQERFLVGDIIDASRESEDNTEYHGAHLSEVVVAVVDDDDTLKFRYVNENGHIRLSSWTSFERCARIHRLGDPLPAASRPAQRQRPPEPPPDRYGFSGKNPGFGE